MYPGKNGQRGAVKTCSAGLDIDASLIDWDNQHIGGGLKKQSENCQGFLFSNKLGKKNPVILLEFIYITWCWD